MSDSSANDHFPGSLAVSRLRIGTLLELTKPRLALLSTLSGLAGYLAAPENFSWAGFTGVALSIFLAAAGALSLNQVLENKIDARMERTQNRPLPTARLSLPHALAFGLVILGVGCLIASLLLPTLATLLIAATVLIYLLLYTPMKRHTCWCTHLGAIPGALPPLVGWTAATGSVGGLGLWLFAILLLWQMPHFFAIAWHCRDDYRSGGLRILSVTHPDGHRLLVENFLYLGLLFPVCLGPVLSGAAGWTYGLASLVLNTFFLLEGIRFAKTVRWGDAHRNRLFLYSLLYLPLLLIFLLFDRTFPS